MHRCNLFHVRSIVPYRQTRLDKLLLQVFALGVFERKDVLKKFSAAVIADGGRAEF